VGACRRAGIESKVEVIKTRLIWMIRLDVAAEGCAREAAY
jgi:hypothetical protein